MEDYWRSYLFAYRRNGMLGNPGVSTWKEKREPSTEPASENHSPADVKYKVFPSGPPNVQVVGFATGVSITSAIVPSGPIRTMQPPP
jgi:hypothetical protein